MSNEDTVPPRQPNTPRNLFLRGLAWAKAWAVGHPEHALRGVVFLAGVLIGKFLL